MADKNEKKFATKFLKWKRVKELIIRVWKEGTYRECVSLKESRPTSQTQLWNRECRNRKRHFNLSKDKTDAETDILNDPLLIAAPENSFWKTDTEIKEKNVFFYKLFERFQHSD